MRVSFLRNHLAVIFPLQYELPALPFTLAGISKRTSPVFKRYQEL
jgi:hypothetical protein